MRASSEREDLQRPAPCISFALPGQKLLRDLSAGLQAPSHKLSRPANAMLASSARGFA